MPCGLLDGRQLLFVQPLIRKPDMAELDAPRTIAGARRGRALQLRRGVKQLEDPLAGSHRGLQDVVFLAQVLDGPEEALGILDEGDQHADGDCVAQHPKPAQPDHQGDGHGAQQLNRGVIERIGHDGVFEGDHVLPVDGFELLVGALLAVEQLHHAHSAYMLLGGGVDAGDGGADAPVGVAHMFAEDAGDPKDKGQHGKGDQGQPPVHAQHDDHDEDENENILENGKDAGSEHLVQRVHIAGEPGDQAPHRIAVEKAYVHALDMPENLAAHVEHDFLSGPLHQVGLHKLEQVAEYQRGRNRRWRFA